MLKQLIPGCGQPGKSHVAAFAKLLAGHNVHFSPGSGDKVARAKPLASQINAGQVLAVRGPWLQPFKDEYRMFPNGTFDDQVDATARGFIGLLHPPGGRNFYLRARKSRRSATLLVPSVARKNGT